MDQARGDSAAKTGSADIAATATPEKPRLFETRIAVMCGAAFIISGLHVPFFPVWLDLIGMNSGQISLILAVAMLARIFSAPFIMAASDRSGERVRILIALSLTSVVCASFFLFTRSFAALVAVSIALGVVSGSQIPITEAIALSGVRRFNSDYARMRVWGSISFLVANLAGGIALQHLGAGILPGLLVAAFVLTAATAQFMPRLGPPRRKAPLPGDVVQSASRAFLKTGFLMFMAADALIQASHAFVYGFSSIYWRSIGIGGTAIGLLWALGVLAEITLFYRFKRHFGTMTPTAMLVIAGIVSVARWVLFPLIEPFGLGLPGFVVIQLLHGITFGLTYLAMQQKTAQAIEEHELGSAQGAVVFIQGLTLATGLYLSGPLYDAANVHGFWVMAVIAAAGLVLAFITQHVEKRQGA